MIDVEKFGLPSEPTFRESLAAGADVVLGSGDKLLGGPQAGIILGKREFVEPIRQHPLARAVRVGKLTLAALSATLDAYSRGRAETEIPLLRLLAATESDLLARAEAIAVKLGGVESLTVEVRPDTALVGGGSLPGAGLPTAVLAVTHAETSADELALRLRTGPQRLFTRIQNDQVLVDLRSVLGEEDSRIVEALESAGVSE